MTHNPRILTPCIILVIDALKSLKTSRYSIEFKGLEETYRINFIVVSIHLFNKVYLYKEFAGITEGPADIADPIGCSIEFYREVKEDIKKASQKIAEKIKE